MVGRFKMDLNRICKLRIIFVLAMAMLSGCASTVMNINQDIVSKINPVGIYICSSTQLRDDGDIKHRNFIIKTATDTLQSKIGNNYDLVFLNDKVSHEQVFKKHSRSFYIDDKKLAEVAKKEGCSSCLILYYAVTEINVTLMNLPPFPPDFFTIREYALKDEQGMSLHARCSLYGWLVSSKDAKVLTVSHNALAPFSEFVEDTNDKERLSRNYANYISTITTEMFLPMIPGK